MKLFPVVGLLLAASVAYADDQTPAAFRTDPSKPVPIAQISPTQPNVTPVSPNTNKSWQNYDSPLRACVQGDTIIPSGGQDMFSFLFHNDAQIAVTMSVQGLKQKQCLVNFSEATNVIYCHFTDEEMMSLMKAILNSSLFDPTGAFAQTLSSNCSSVPPQN
jgi:hypothetical protein